MISVYIHRLEFVCSDSAMRFIVCCYVHNEIHIVSMFVILAPIGFAYVGEIIHKYVYDSLIGAL